MARFQLIPPEPRWPVPALLGLLAAALVLTSVDPGGSYPRAPQGPGLTIDESFNVQQGVYLIEAVRAYGLGLLHPQSVREVFGQPAFLPDHPPLGRFWLGVFHHACWWLVLPFEPETPFAIACARTGSAVAFGLQVFLVGWFAARWYGRTAGVIAAIAVVLMPRLFGHAHLASLETMMNLTYSTAVLTAAEAWTRSPPARWRTAAWTGAFFGLALLTKMQAVFLPIPLGVWAMLHWRRKAIVPLAVWGMAGLTVFFCGWPWLWLDPLDHLWEYFARTTERVELSVWYFGERYPDRAVPWHYPFVMFLITVPLGLHLLGGLGVAASSARMRFLEPREQLMLGQTVFPLVMFALPGIAVYDGARLFLVVFPLWAIFVGHGGAFALEWLAARMSRKVAVSALAVFMLAQCWGLIAMRPAWLSYHNLLVGGLRGASAIGLEPTYWGDSLTRRLLEETVGEVPRGSTIHIAPVLHQFQLDDLLHESPVLRSHGIRLAPYDMAAGSDATYILLFRRKADLPPDLLAGPTDAELLAETRREGVQLAALYRVGR